MLDEYLEDEQAEKKRDYEAWNLNKDDGTKVEMPQREKEVVESYGKEVVESYEKEVVESYEQDEVKEEEEENIDELIDMQYARPPKEEWDGESICSTYTNTVTHPRVIACVVDW